MLPMVNSRGEYSPKRNFDQLPTKKSGALRSTPVKELEAEDYNEAFDQDLFTYDSPWPVSGKIRLLSLPVAGSFKNK